MARYTLPPRQKMINLLYILLIAMLAINTTSDAQKKEKERREQELKELAEAYHKLDREMQQKKLENHKASIREKTEFAREVIVNDTPVRLTGNGELEKPVVMVASSFSNHLYKNHKNPLNVIAVGIKSEDLHLEMKNGTVQRSGKEWIATPDANATEVKLMASYQKADNRLPIGEFRFLIKALPTPVSYLHYTKGSPYRGNVPVKRSALLAATEVGASTTEPEMEFNVVSFETILIKENGKLVSTVRAEGNQLTLEQKSQIGQLEEGDAFYITSIIVEGPDGQKRQSNPINVIVIK